MRVLRTTSLVGVILLGTSVLVGCSDGNGDQSTDTTVNQGDDAAGDTVGPDNGQIDDSTDEGQLIVSLTGEVQSSFSEEGVGADLPTDEAECTAESIVDAIGVVRLAELGVTPDDSSALDAVVRDNANTDERQVVAAALHDCVDLVRTFTAVYAAAGLSESSAGCAAEAIVDDAELRTTLLLGDEPGDAVATRFDAVAQNCFTAEELELFTSGEG